MASPERPAASVPDAVWMRLADHFSEELVARWHDTPPGTPGLPESLAEFMGLTDKQYAAWAECSWADVLPRPLQYNPEPLSIVERRDDVTALAAIQGRSREDRLRVWLALGGTNEDFPDV